MYLIDELHVDTNENINSGIFYVLFVFITSIN